MKFCKPTRGVKEEQARTLTFDYVMLSDIKLHHGEQFLEQWKTFATKTRPIFLDGQEAYYYADYKQHAMTTRMYLDLP
jgi:hypothetical protein